MKKVFFQFSLILFAVFSFPAKGQTIFDIEFVFFKRLDADGNFNYLSLEAPTAQEQIYTLTPSLSLPENYQLLERSERRLEGVFNRLKTSANMRPLLHIAWRQPLTDKDETAWLSFILSDEPHEKGLQDFIGNIRFSRNQGLLFEANISGLKEADPNIIIEPSDGQTPEQLIGYFGLEESRKVKINTLNYFDHPTMGILVKITPYQATIEEQEALQQQQ